MSRLIIICGLPGTGKTTLATELSKKLKIFCLHKDSIKESLYSSMKLSSLEDSKRIGYPAVKVALDIAEENIKNGIDVILESPFNFAKEGEVFSHWKDKYPVSISVIVLELENKKRKERFTARMEADRHPAHHDTDRMRQYEEEVCSYEHMPEKKIYIDSDQSLEKLLQLVTDFIQ